MKTLTEDQFLAMLNTIEKHENESEDLNHAIAVLRSAWAIRDTEQIKFQIIN
jgi:hypothetical protein